MLVGGAGRHAGICQLVSKRLRRIGATHKDAKKQTYNKRQQELAAFSFCRLPSSQGGPGAGLREEGDAVAELRGAAHGRPLSVDLRCSGETNSREFFFFH